MHGLARPRAVPALLLALTLGLTLTSCTDTDPVAPEGSIIILSASPTNIDNAAGGLSNITAVVLDQNSIPLDGVAVFFSTNAGSLESQGIGQTTDSNGRAVDFLNTSQSATVNAQSGSAVSSVTVTVGGVVLVGSITLAATTPTSGLAPLLVSFTAVVTDTNNQPMSGQILSVNIVGGSGAIPAPALPVTDAFGTATFDVEQINEAAEISVSIGSISSPSVLIEITTR